MSDQKIVDKIKRSQIDSPYQRNTAPDSYKNRGFAGGRITGDEYTGRTVYYSPNGANKGKEGARHYTSERTSNIDHITPIDKLIESYGGRIPIEDLQRIANNDKNLAITNERLNKSKGGQTNVEYLLKQLQNGTPEDAETTIRMISKQLESEGFVKVEVTKAGIRVLKDTTKTTLNSSLGYLQQVAEEASHAIKTGGKELIEGAQDALAASAIPLVVRGTQNLMRVANGELTMKEAAEDIGTLGASIAVSGGIMRTASYALSTALKHSENEIVKRFADVNQVGTILVISSIVVRATGKYLNGEIDSKAFFDEIGESSLSLASGMLASEAVELMFAGTVAAEGSIAAAAIGGAPVIAAMIASAACSEIYACAKKLDEDKKSNAEIRMIAMDAQRSIAQQQETLNELLTQNHEQWVQEMTDVFQYIARGIVSSNVDETNKGLRKLMNIVGREVKLYSESDSLVDDLFAARSREGGMRILR